MILWKKLLAATTLTFALTPLAAEAQLFARTPPVYFPALSGKSLAGEAFRFPEQLAGQASLIFLTWSAEQESFLESWMPAIHHLLLEYENLHFYVLALLPKSEESSVGRKGWPWARSSRPALSTDEQQKILIPVYADRDRVLRALKLEPGAYSYIVLVDPQGQVQWTERGARNNGKGDDLDLQIAQAASGRREP